MDKEFRDVNLDRVVEVDGAYFGGMVTQEPQEESESSRVGENQERVWIGPDRNWERPPWDRDSVLPPIFAFQLMRATHPLKRKFTCQIRAAAPLAEK